jgi:hypothetical protein
MMQQEDLWRQLITLPPDAQQQVIDFISFLPTRYASTQVSKTAERTRLASELFIGMWRDRKDLQDSSAWVQNIREREWVKRRD